MKGFGNIMKEAQKLQQQMEALQAEVGKKKVQATAGGGMVAVRLTGKSELKGTRIDDSLLNPDQKEILEDLLIAAHADARRKAEALLQDKMKALTGGLPLPPGMKLF